MAISKTSRETAFEIGTLKEDCKMKPQITVAQEFQCYHFWTEGRLALHLLTGLLKVGYQLTTGFCK